MVQQILKPALDNDCGTLRMICTLDSKTYKSFWNQCTTLSELLPGYLIDMVNVSTYFPFACGVLKCFMFKSFWDLTHLFSYQKYQKLRTRLFTIHANMFLLFNTLLFLLDWSSKLTEEVLKRKWLVVSENTKVMLESSVQQDLGSSQNSFNFCTMHCLCDLPDAQRRQSQ